MSNEQPESLRMLFAELEPLKVRPWNIFSVLAKMLAVQKKVVGTLVQHEAEISMAVETYETAVAVGMNLESRIDKLWQEVYERQEKDIERLEAKMDTLLEAIREEDETDGNTETH